MLVSFWLFGSKNRWRFLVDLVVESSTRETHLFPLKGHLWQWISQRFVCIYRGIMMPECLSLRWAATDFSIRTKTGGQLHRWDPFFLDRPIWPWTSATCRTFGGHVGASFVVPGSYLESPNLTRIKNGIRHCPKSSLVIYSLFKGHGDSRCVFC